MIREIGQKDQFGILQQSLNHSRHHKEIFHLLLIQMVHIWDMFTKPLPLMVQIVMILMALLGITDGTLTMMVNLILHGSYLRQHTHIHLRVFTL